ncbi:hypothetical protein RYX36_012978, partial [Vicia faba]
PKRSRIKVRARKESSDARVKKKEKTSTSPQGLVEDVSLFLSLKKDYDPRMVKAFYCSFNITEDGLECHLKDKIITFIVNDFNTHFGVPIGGDEVNT